MSYTQIVKVDSSWDIQELNVQAQGNLVFVEGLDLAKITEFNLVAHSDSVQPDQLGVTFFVKNLMTGNYVSRDSFSFAPFVDEVASLGQNTLFCPGIYRIEISPDDAQLNFGNRYFLLTR